MLEKGEVKAAARVQVVQANLLACSIHSLTHVKGRGNVCVTILAMMKQSRESRPCQLFARGPRYATSPYPSFEVRQASRQ